MLDVVEKAILLFREQGMTGERFSQTIDRLGFENVEKTASGQRPAGEEAGDSGRHPSCGREEPAADKDRPEAAGFGRYAAEQY